MAQAADQELVSRLMASNEEYRRLAAEHSNYDRRLEELSHRKFPSPDEQVEEMTLKKKKLHLKDRMYGILREHQAQAS
jgi:uncharacterized protein YdcH (DUF465 family)